MKRSNGKCDLRRGSKDCCNCGACEEEMPEQDYDAKHDEVDTAEEE